MWSGAWNKRKKIPSEISNRFLASSVGRAGDWCSGGRGFKPHGEQFLTKFILCCVTSDLSDNLTEMRQTGLSWKTRLTFKLTVQHPIEQSKPQPLNHLPAHSLPFRKIMLLVSDMNMVLSSEVELSLIKKQFPGSVPLYWKALHSADPEHLNHIHMLFQS